MMSLTVRMDILVSLLLSLVVFTFGHVLLFFVWGYCLQAVTVGRWDDYLDTQPDAKPVPASKRYVVLIGMLVAAPLAHILFTLGAVLANYNEKIAGILSVILGVVFLLGTAHILSRFVNRTWNMSVRHKQ